MRSKSRALLLALGVVLVVLALAAPAMATSNVAKGDTQLTVPKAKVAELLTKATTINAFNEIVYKPRWSANSLTWWFDSPIWTKVINSSYWTNYNTKSGKGVFYHSGQLVWVNAASSPQKGLKWQGIRVQAVDKTHYSLIATVGNAKPYVSTVVATATGGKITHSGKKYQIAGLKFFLTTQAQTQLATSTGVTVPTAGQLFAGNMFFTMK
jgi:hypothetical protein